MPNQIELVPGLRIDASATAPALPSELRVKPELLSPAGDRMCLLAAVENGADAVYFGLRRNNARIRAVNFDGAELAEVMALLHRRGVRGYVTLNTLRPPDLWDSVVEPSSGFGLRRRASRQVAGWCQDR